MFIWFQGLNFIICGVFVVGWFGRGATQVTTDREMSNGSSTGESTYLIEKKSNVLWRKIEMKHSFLEVAVAIEFVTGQWKAIRGGWHPSSDEILPTSRLHTTEYKIHTSQCSKRRTKCKKRSTECTVQYIVQLTVSALCVYKIQKHHIKRSQTHPTVWRAQLNVHT